MKKLFLTAAIVGLAFWSQAAPWHTRHGHFGHYYHHPRHHGHFGFYPNYSFSLSYYPDYGYSYYPAYSYYPVAPSYGYYAAGRPNYAVGGTLLGALAGGLIGHGINHQGWEGAAIGAGAGLLLGSVAERNARIREQAYTSPLPTYYAPQTYSVPDTPTVPQAPTAPAAPQIPEPRSNPSSGPMSAANSLFGR